MFNVLAKGLSQHSIYQPCKFVGSTFVAIYQCRCLPGFRGLNHCERFRVLLQALS